MADNAIDPNDYALLLGLLNGGNLGSSGGLGGLGGFSPSGMVSPNGPVPSSYDTPVPPSQLARQLTPSEAQSSLTDNDFLRILELAHSRSNGLVQKTWDNFVGAGGTTPDDQSARNIFTDLGKVAPIDPLEEMKRYAVGAPSQVTDPEGRTGHPLFVAGTTPDGKGVPLSKGNIAALGDIMAHIQGLDMPGDQWGGTAFRSGPSKPGMSNTSIALNTGGASNGTTPSDVLAHEIGHTVHNFLGIRNAPLAGAPSPAMQQFNSFGASRAASAGVSPANNAEVGGLDAYKYFMSPDENFAEAFRAYATDPNAFKAKNPDAAAYLRNLVNSNPALSKLLMLSDNTSGYGGATYG